MKSYKEGFKFFINNFWFIIVLLSLFGNFAGFYEITLKGAMFLNVFILLGIYIKINYALEKKEKDYECKNWRQFEFYFYFRK